MVELDSGMLIKDFLKKNKNGVIDKKKFKKELLLEITKSAMLGVLDANLEYCYRFDYPKDPSKPCYNRMNHSKGFIPKERVKTLKQAAYYNSYLKTSKNIKNVEKAIDYREFVEEYGTIDSPNKLAIGIFTPDGFADFA